MSLTLDPGSRYAPTVLVTHILKTDEDTNQESPSLHKKMSCA